MVNQQIDILLNIQLDITVFKLACLCYFYLKKIVNKLVTDDKHLEIKTFYFA